MAYPAGMEQFAILALGWAVGVIVCAVLVQRVTARLGLPWRAALMYFGVVPYPEELAVGRRSSPSRSGRAVSQARRARV